MFAPNTNFSVAVSSLSSFDFVSIRDNIDVKIDRIL